MKSRSTSIFKGCASALDVLMDVMAIDSHLFSALHMPADEQQDVCERTIV